METRSRVAGLTAQIARRIYYRMQTITSRSQTSEFHMTEISGNSLPNGLCVIEPLNGDAFAVSRLLDDTK